MDFSVCDAVEPNHLGIYDQSNAGEPNHQAIYDQSDAGEPNLQAICDQSNGFFGLTEMGSSSTDRDVLTLSPYSKMIIDKLASMEDTGDDISMGMLGYPRSLDGNISLL